MFYILAHIASFAWYSAISIGPRFTYGIFLPVMFSIFAGSKALDDNQVSAPLKQAINPALSRYSFAANIIMTDILIINIWLVVSRGLFSGLFAF